MKRILALCLALVLVFGVVLTGCSSGNTEEPAEPSGQTQGADISELEAMIAEASKLPEFKLQAEKIDAKAIMAGKKVMSIPSNSSNPFATGGCERIGAILKELGATNFIWENQGTPAEWNAGIESAINQKYDFVQMYGGCDPGLVAGGYALLKQAGIPLMTTHFGKAGAPIESADYRLGMDFYKAGQLMAAWTIVKGGTDVKVAVLCEYDTESGPQIVQAMKDTYAKYAPEATVEFITVPINDWATKCQNETQNAIQRIPGLDYVVPIYDSMSQYVVPGIEMAGKTGEVKCISYNGTPFVLDLVREGKVEMVVGESIDWICHAAVDIMIRAIGGEEVVLDQKVPHYLFTKENVENAGVPAEYGKGYGDAYAAGYRALWGLE